MGTGKTGSKTEGRGVQKMVVAEGLQAAKLRLDNAKLAQAFDEVLLGVTPHDQVVKQVDAGDYTKHFARLVVDSAARRNDELHDALVERANAVLAGKARDRSALIEQAAADAVSRGRYRFTVQPHSGLDRALAELAQRRKEARRVRIRTRALVFFQRERQRIERLFGVNEPWWAR